MKCRNSLINENVVERGINEIRITTQHTSNAVSYLGTEHKRDKIKRWLSPPDPSTNYNKALMQRHKDSGGWFIESESFAEWKTRQSSFLWLHGIPGCGKTILSSAIIKNLDSAGAFSPLLYFYFDFNDTGKQKLHSMLCALLSQLYYKNLNTSQEQLLESLYTSHEDGYRQPSTESLCQVLFQILDQFKEVWLVLDALDECDTRKGSSTEGILSWIRETLESKQRNIHLLVTSRPETDIAFEIKAFAQECNIVHLQRSLITNDIRAYVRTRLECDGFTRWTSKPAILNEIENTLMKKADGM
jgi:hypothetical protein